MSYSLVHIEKECNYIFVIFVTNQSYDCRKADRREKNDDIRKKYGESIVWTVVGTISKYKLCVYSYLCA